MAKLVNIQFTGFKATRVIGKSIMGQVNPEINPLPAFWDQCFNDGTFTTLESMKESKYQVWQGGAPRVTPLFVV